MTIEATPDATAAAMPAFAPPGDGMWRSLDEIRRIGALTGLAEAEPTPDADANADADADAWRTPEQRGRVIEVVGKADEAGQWWTLRTSPGRDPAATAPPIEGLEFYALTFYVPAGTGLPLDGPPPSAATSSWPRGSPDRGP